MVFYKSFNWVYNDEKPVRKRWVKWFFDKSKLKVSDYPSDFIPKDSVEILGFDTADGVDTTVKGLYQNGIYHVQEVINNKDQQCNNT